MMMLMVTSSLSNLLGRLLHLPHGCVMNDDPLQLALDYDLLMLAIKRRCTHYKCVLILLLFDVT